MMKAVTHIEDSMNRHERRRAAAQVRGFSEPNDCPCCNLRKVFMQAVEHAQEIADAAGRTVIYPLVADPHSDTMRVAEPGDEAYSLVVLDLGVLAIEYSPTSDEYTQRQFGEVAMTETPEDATIEKPGPWIGMQRFNSPWIIADFQFTD